MSALPLDFPPLLGAAEEIAREAHDAWEAAIRAVGGTRFLIEETLATRATLGVEAEADAHAHLLADLTRPAARDFWARWLAGRVGLVCGTTAPRWEHESSHADWGGARWVLSSNCYDEDVGDHEAFSSEAPESWCAVPGISSILDPNAALVAALLATEPR